MARNVNMNSKERVLPLILIVDDNEDMQIQYKHSLSSEEYLVVEASNAKEAIHIFIQYEPDIVLIDLTLPELDGLAACKKIRDHPHGKKTPILMITSCDKPQTIDEAFEAGATEYITKPIHWATFHRRIRALIALSRSEAKLAASEARMNAVVVRDIAERKRNETRLRKVNEELEEANVKLKELDRLKSTFIASMSHELRTPLNSIIGFIGIILQGMAGDVTEEQRDMLQRSYDASKHLLSLISDVIDISRVEAGRIETNVEDFQLEDLISIAVLDIKSEADKKGLTIKTVIPANTALSTDMKRLLQCLLNYLSNAVKFTEKGNITLKALEIDELIEISVEDTGIGFKKEDVSAIFDSFIRLDSPLKIQTTGTGLGLYLTKKLVSDILQGEVTASSTYGKGSIFTLRIPKAITKFNAINKIHSSVQNNK